MKIWICVFVLCMVETVWAVDALPMAFAVERDLNGLFSETINEGEAYAEVLKVNGKPQVRCSPLIQKGKSKLTFCSVEVRVEFTSGGEEEFGFADCMSLGYVLNAKGQIKDRYNDEAFAQCLEKAYDASYD